MATLHVRNVPETLYEALRARADGNGRSIGAEAILLLEQELTAVALSRPGLLSGRRRRRPVAPFTRFTERGRGVVTAAQEEARKLGHDRIGTGHLLLGLLVVGEGPGAEALQALGLTVDRVRTEVAERVPAGAEERPGRIPFEPGAKKALELALREALALRHVHIGTEHLLLGIVREGEGVGAQIVALVESDTAAVRACVLRTVATASAAEALTVRPPDPPAFRVVELTGSAAEWEGRLNDAATDGFDLVEVVGDRAILRRDE